MNRLERDRPSIKPVDKFSFKEVIRSACSPHIIMFFVLAFLHATMSSGLALFLPSIVKELGFSRNTTQLLSAGPFASGFFRENFSNVISLQAYSLLIPSVTLLTAHLSDRYESRGIIAALNAMLAVAGFALYLGNVLCLNEDSYLEIKC